MSQFRTFVYNCGETEAAGFPRRRAGPQNRCVSLYLDIHTVAWIRSTSVAEGILMGSPDLEREFAERFLPRLQVFFRARVSDPDLREELIQETLVAALLALRAGKLRETSAIDGFVVGIARNLLAEAIRSKTKNPAGAAGDEIDSRAIASGLEPELRLAVQNELQDLAEVDQRILRLILIEGLRPAEVAPQVSLTEEAVRQRKSRTLRRLHEKLFGSRVTNSPSSPTLPQSST
ncbi:MAG: sigma-70 family RNA polymerase sigma factor, partial [Acidobacteria bacterium]|nr:sigma-70 family RNA polymerase sigma factor [Acidobacteriota bacterium]